MTIRLVTADLQLAAGERDSYRTDFLKQRLPQLIKKYKVEELLILGDLTEEKDAHRAPLVNDIVDAIADIASSSRVFILQGNHDYLSIEHPFFAFLERIEGVEWISKPTVRLGDCFLPHTRDHKRDWAGWDFKQFDGEYIFAHNIFSGVKANGQSLSGIPLSVFTKNSVVISGDVHEPQSFGCITYVGSPYLCDHGDDYLPRVLILDDNNLDDKKMVSVRLHGPQKRLVKISWPDLTNQSANPGDIVKIQVDLEMQHVATWDSEIRPQVEDWAAKQGFKVFAIMPVVAYVPGKRAVADRKTIKSPKDYIESYAKRRGLDEELLKTGNELVEGLT